MNATTKDDDGELENMEGPRGFSHLLQQVQDGELHAELSENLQQLMKDLRLYSDRFQRDAKGNITLSLNVTVHGNGSVSIMGDVKMKTPKTPRAPSTFFLTPGNNLTLENPRQQRLPLREVPIPKREAPRDVGDDKAEVRTI